MKQNTWKRLDNAILETLEGREMMSVTALTPVALSNSGVLTVNSPLASGSQVRLDLATNSTVLRINVNGQIQNMPLNQVKQFQINTGSGADYIYINPAIDIPAVIHSGDGNDSIHGGAGNDTIVSGNGNVLIYGKGGNNTMEVGSGNDALLGDHGNDIMIAGNGNDTLVGGGGSDVMTAGNGNDMFQAGNAHDTITAGTGHDTLLGDSTNTYTHGTPVAVTAPAAPTAPVVHASPTPPATAPVSTAPSTSPAPSTPTVGQTPPSTGATGPVATPGSLKPVAALTILSGPRQTGMVVSVDGLTSTIGTGTPDTTNYAWNFGDGTVQDNQLTGYNSAHVYDQPGTYKISLTVTNNQGMTSVATQTVTIAASTRSQRYVDPVNGSDSNSGSINAPFKTLAAAFTGLGNNSEVLLKAGHTFDTALSMNVNLQNVLIGRYGTGANPTIVRSLGDGLSTISAASGTNGLTIQDITFDTPFAVSATSAATKDGVGAIYLDGQNITVRDCTFLNVDDAINENGNPTGVLIQNNTAPLVTGIRGYFVWGQGNQTVIVGNYVANSTREHVVRLKYMSQVAVLDNNFTNLNRQSVDPYDVSKGCIEVQWASYAWVKGNTVTGGDIRIGPLGLWGEAATSSTDYSVIEDNNLTGTQIYVQSGAHHAMIANNVINNTGGQVIMIKGVDAEGRTSSDINIIGNTAINTSTAGNFVEVAGWASGIVMKNNLWVAPNIQIGSYGTAPVSVNDADLSCFTQISDNVWPVPAYISKFAGGGINYVGTSMVTSSFQSAKAWDAMSPVQGDVFQNATLAGTYQTTVGATTAGSSLKMAA